MSTARLLDLNADSACIAIGKQIVQLWAAEDPRLTYKLGRPVWQQSFLVESESDESEEMATLTWRQLFPRSEYCEEFEELVDYESPDSITIFGETIQFD